MRYFSPCSPVPPPPQDAAVFRELGKQVHVQVDPVRVVPLVERYPASILQFIAAVAEASRAIAEG